MGDYSVYLHINKLNNKKYVGITSQEPQARWKSGAGYRNQRRFYCAIKSYGWDGFYHVVLYRGLSKEEAETKEQQLIAFYNSNDSKCGYNIENGGVTHKLSAEQKQHLADVNTGKTHSEATKEKMSVAHRAIGAPWMSGKRHKESSKRKMGISRRGTRNGRAKEVYQYDLSGQYVRKYDYMDLVKQSLGISSTAHISQCCNGKRDSAYGFMWSYVLEEKKPYVRIRKGGVTHGEW